MRHLLEVDDLTPAELGRVLDLAVEPAPPQVLDGRGMALLFEKPSVRTRNSMEMAISETNRRREIQMRHNREHGIVPSTILKEIHDLTERVKAVAEQRVEYRVGKEMPKDEAFRLIKELERQMQLAAAALEFEKAALIRDQIIEMRRSLQDEEGIPEWERYR